MKKIVPSNAVLIPHRARRVFEGVIYDVYQWPQELFDGSTTTFEMLRRPDTVDILGIVDDKVIVLNDEQPHRGSRLSLPGGRVDKDEDVTAAARREALEETGYDFKNWRLLKVWQVSTQIEWFIHLYLAWYGEQSSEPHPDAGEKITVERISIEGLKRLLQTQGSYLREIRDVLEPVHNTQELLSLPSFQGKEVDH